MHLRLRLILLVNSLFVLAVATAFGANDPTTEIALTQVPRAVMETVKRKFPDARPQSASRGIEDNKPFYDVFIKVREQNIWVTCDATGTVLVVDREIAPRELPKPVSESLLRR